MTTMCTAMEADELRRWWRETLADGARRDAFDYPFARLNGRYEAAAADERRVLGDLLGEWALSDDPAERFAAVGVAQRHRVGQAVPGLRRLAERLRTSDDAQAPSELHRVEMFIQDIEAREERRPAGSPLELIELERTLPESKRTSGASDAQLDALEGYVAALADARDPAKIDEAATLLVRMAMEFGLDLHSDLALAVAEFANERRHC